jgi:hypothetical protein
MTRVKFRPTPERPQLDNVLTVANPPEHPNSGGIPMFARVASFAGGDVDRLRELNEQRLNDGTMNLPAGLTGAMVLQDSANDRRLFISFFDSRESIEAAASRLEAMGEEIPEEIRGRRTAVDVYEVVWQQDA